MYSDMWGAYVGGHVGNGAAPVGRDCDGLESITVFVLLDWEQMLDKQSRLYWLERSLESFRTTCVGGIKAGYLKTMRWQAVSWEGSYG